MRNNDGSPWVWSIGVPRLVLLAATSFLGFHYAFGLGWLGAGIAVAAAFSLAAAVWGTFAWLNATGRQLPIPVWLLLRAARRKDSAARRD